MIADHILDAIKDRYSPEELIEVLKLDIDTTVDLLYNVIEERIHLLSDELHELLEDCDDDSI